MRERLISLRRHPAFVPTAIGTTAGVAAGILGTLGVQWYLDKRWVKSLQLDDIPEEDVRDYEELENLDEAPEEDTRKFQTVVTSDGRVYKRLADLYREKESEVSDDQDHEETETERHNIFADPVTVEEAEEYESPVDPVDPNWNMAAESASRTRDTPYVIHVEEYYNNERGFPQAALTYFAGDDVMVDERDVPVPNYSKIVGPELKFGHGSGDESVVFVRNEKLQLEFEVIRDEGHYIHEILGVDDFKEDSRPPKFKPEQD